MSSKTLTYIALLLCFFTEFGCNAQNVNARADYFPVFEIKNSRNVTANDSENIWAIETIDGVISIPGVLDLWYKNGAYKPFYIQNLVDRNLKLNVTNIRVDPGKTYSTIGLDGNRKGYGAIADIHTGAPSDCAILIRAGQSFRCVNVDKYHLQQDSIYVNYSGGLVNLGAPLGCSDNKIYGLLTRQQEDLLEFVALRNRIQEITNEWNESSGSRFKVPFVEILVITFVKVLL